MFGLDPQVLEFMEQLGRPARPEEPEELFATEPTEIQRRQTRQAAGEKARLAHARKELEESYLPGVKAYAIRAGAGIVSPAARLLRQEEYADRMNRFAGTIEQVARERERGGIVPDILQRGARGAAVSLTTMIPAAAVAGPYGAIAAASAQETNSAITEGRDTGKKGLGLAGYAISQGVIEGTPAAVMQRVGLGGLESLASKRIVSTGAKEGLKRLGISAAQELPEEIITELGHNVAAKISGVEPNALSAENLKQTVADTTVQTLIVVGFAGAPSVAHSAEAGKVARISGEITTYAEEGKIPSRKTWRKWGLAPEMGGTRKQRQAYVQELAKQLEAPPAEVEPEAVTPPVAPEAPEAAVEAPEIVAEAPVVPEAVETPMAPEAVTEAPGAAEVQAETQNLAENAGAPKPDPTKPVLEDQTTALNKAEGAKIREFVNLPALSEEAVQTWDSVMEQVAVNKADENALDTATEVMRTRRQITSYEYGAMALKVGKLLNDLEVVQSRQSEAAEAGKKFSHKKASVQIETIVGQLDLLTEAARHSRREIARALSIGGMRLSRENFDVVHIIQRMQGAKGPKAKLSKKQLSEATRHAKRHADLVEQVARLEEESRIKDEQLDAALAGKVFEASKPRKKVGRSVREKAIIEREDIKSRIRQMGLRVNDITIVTVEGTYLIGRLGITYIKEGVGTLIEVAERLRADLPDLNLTNQDVYQALITRSPKEKTRAKSEVNKQVARLTSMARMHVELEDLANGVDSAVKRKKATVPEEVKALKKKLTEVRLRFYAADIEAAKKERAIETVNRLQDQLDNGLIQLKESPKEISPELVDLHDQARQLRMEIGVDMELAKAKEAKKQISEDTYIPPPERVKKPVNRKLEHKRIELTKERREIRQMIADAAPWTVGKVTKEVAFTLKAVKATADISFTMRQNLWQVFSHPVLGAKAFTPALKAFFSEYSADQINNSIRNSENGLAYEQAGLAILDGESPDQAQRSEVFRARLIERIPGVGSVIRASSRHAAAFSNLMRTSAFDQFMENHPNATQDQMVAFADYLNVSTGLGNLGKLGAVGDSLQVVFFSPKFSVSRVQTPWALMKYRNMPGVRNQIAKDMVKVISTGGMVLALAAMAGADVEWLDVDDPDWGKIRIGNIRIDVWGGFQQPARAIARLATGAFYKDFDPLEILGRFAAFKLAPIITMPIELAREVTAVGEETTRLETIGRSFVPLVIEDIRDAWREEGAAAGLGIGALAIAGVGISAYKDSETATRREIGKLQKAGDWGRANLLKLEWNRENPKNRIVTVKTK